MEQHLSAKCQLMVVPMFLNIDIRLDRYGPMNTEILVGIGIQVECVDGLELINHFYHTYRCDFFI